MSEFVLPVARKLLVMEVAGLGDNVHLLPALWLARRSYPNAQLHVLASARSQPLFQLVPWVDRVLGYPWNPRPSLIEHLRWGLRLRRERYDLVINFSGSDRTTLLTRMSGARERWGRRPHDGGMTGFAAFYTRVLEHPFYREPMYRQKFEVLRAQGFTGSEAPEFHVEWPAGVLKGIGIAPVDEKRYLHVSPFASHPRKELPLSQMAALLGELHRRFPDRPMALSCADDPRERARLAELLAQLDFSPWKIFAGSLDVAQLASVIRGAALHLCPDTGSFHLAVMANTPAVVWYRRHGGEAEWVPQDGPYRVLFSGEGNEQALGGIDNTALLAAAAELLAGGPILK